MAPYINTPAYIARFTILYMLVWWLVGCSGATSDGAIFETDAEAVVTDDELSALDSELSSLISNFDLDAPFEVDHLPDISEPLPQLGMTLFYSKSLGGDFDSACVTCHHPALGGADALSLPVGVGALQPEVLGPERQHSEGVPLVPRNSPTVFNVGLWDTSLFWDSRVESIGKEATANGALSGIRTPDSTYLIADSEAGPNLVAAQARFPVTSAEEMRGDLFESGGDNQAIRDHLAQRIGGYGAAAGELVTNEWLALFQEAFSVSAEAETLVTFDNIALAIGEFERSMVFVDSPWRRYLEGDLSALSDNQKAGAVLFFTSTNAGGAGCAACHNGPLLSDGGHHVVGFPQGGPGKGDVNDDDFARERETSEVSDRYAFRTPSLLNIELTAPYGHAGTYETLEEVVRHYINPDRAVERFFDRGGMCGLAQFEDVANCFALYPNNELNSERALEVLAEQRRTGATLFQSPRLNDNEVDQIVAFMESLSDDCTLDRECLGAWIPDTSSSGPDGHQLNAVNGDGDLL